LGATVVSTSFSVHSGASIWVTVTRTGRATKVVLITGIVSFGISTSTLLRLSPGSSSM